MSQDARILEEQATAHRARVLGLEYINTQTLPEKPLFREVLTVPELYQMRVIPLRADKSHVQFGITTTTSQQVINSLQQRFSDQIVSRVLISDSGFKDYMRLFDPPKPVEYQNIALNTAGTKDLIDTVSATLEQVRADDMLAYLVQQAHRLFASDIHIETEKDFVRIRFRIDGVLHPVARLTYEKYKILIDAIASAGNVSTNSNEAQQGHISQHFKMQDGTEVNVNIRLETVPTINAMDVVMRLFNMEPNMYTLDKLDLSTDERKVVDGIISKPTGLMMMVGPTGSGKTTTLYSVLNTLNSTERKIITIEDPVEYQFEGITQISVHTAEAGNDSSFASKLRAVLRLDPDVVMVGEVRDMDTASTALQGALTGHLVLCTFHANNAAAALTRLAGIIGQNPLFISAIRLVMAQRLVRRLDPDSKQAYVPDEATVARIKAVVDGLPANILKPDLTNLKLYKEAKSTENPYGFRGQLPIREQFLMTGEVRQLLQNPSRVLSTEDIEVAAVKSGMRTMLQDGILKAIAGETSLEEIYRVVG